MFHRLMLARSVPGQQVKQRLASVVDRVQLPSQAGLEGGIARLSISASISAVIVAVVIVVTCVKPSSAPAFCPSSGCPVESLAVQ